MNLKPSTRVEFGAGYGFDDPDDAALGATARKKNVQTTAHLHLRPAGPIILGFEYRRLETTYTSGPLVNDHFNVAFGFIF